ncbi:Ku protein [Glycocaulis sp.]|uniref:non-homologous end joining protein Ku n=1 Tax=Glycocaulis sp. TaxID=1969725 RepID=UPI003D24BA9E
MAAPRTYWTGHLRLSLVSIDIALYSATSRSGRTSLRQIHKKSGQPIRYQKTADGIGPVDADEIVKGFEAQKGSFVILEPEEIEEIRLESQDAIRIVQFVDHHEIDPRFYDKPYYVAPRGKAASEGFVVIREALRSAKKTALGQMTTRGREHLIAIRSCGDGLLLETLRYADEVKNSNSVFADIGNVDVDDEMLELAEDLIAKKTAPFDPGAFRDSYEAALRELIEEKAKGKAIVSAKGGKKAKSAQVIDLMEALKKSVKEERAGRSGKSPARKKTAGKTATKSKSSSSRNRKAG